MISCSLFSNICLFLVNPGINRFGPVVHSFRKPHFQFMLGSFWRVTAMANVASKIDRVIPADGTRGRCQWLCLTQHGTSLLDDIFSFPTHANNGAGTKELGQTFEETLFGEIRIVLLGHGFGGPDHFEADQLVSPLFKSGNNITNQSALDTIGLDSEEGAFLVGSRLSPHRKRLFFARSRHTDFVVRLLDPKSSTHQQAQRCHHVGSSGAGSLPSGRCRQAASRSRSKRGRTESRSKTRRSTRKHCWRFWMYVNE
mmetsp:Transcript_36881/g.76708  ORF Transcript_36881/g.76708 Transcript_36881/m.76708 type:complete len:255 (+) Transcript_36881:121-885(+)